jgi:tetratricopeptide (TPR) repeat protein
MEVGAVSEESFGHPTLEQLAAFARGDVTDDEAVTIESHLSTCRACDTQIALASLDDPLTELLRVAGRAADKEDDQDFPVDGSKALTGYEILKVIGRGGMGVVYQAQQVALGRLVALKQIRAGLGGSAQELTRFRTEAEAAAKLLHPGIVQVYDVGWRDDGPFLAMELVVGGTLEERLRKKPLGPREAAALVAAITRAVHHAHECGVVHRDLKPGNVLLTRDGQAKISDFGLAKRLDVEQGPTQTGALLGTPGYMAPEQAEGKACGAPADLYGLGAILYECLTGRPPFQAATPLETLDQVRTSEPAPPSRLQPGVPRELETICLKCLEKDPRRRYGSAELLADDLDRFLRGEPILARPVGAIERSWKWAKREPWKATLAAFSLIAVAGAFAGLLAHQARLQIETDKANRAANEARAQRAVAETNYREARGAIGRMLELAGDPRRAGLPAADELRVAQTEAALGFFDHVLAAADSPDPVVRLDTALAAREAGNIQVGLGRPEAAERNLERSARLLDALAAKRPDDAQLARERMVSWLKLGVCLPERDNPRAVRALTTAVGLAERAVQRDPTSRAAQADLAWCEHNLGSAHLIANHHAEAEPHLRRAIELRRPLAADDLKRGAELAGTLVNLSLVVGRTQPELADPCLKEAAGLLDTALKAQPGELEFLFPLAQLLEDWGNIAARLGNPTLALERFEKGLAIMEPLIQSRPALETPRTTALNLHGSRANVLDSLGRYSEAACDWDRVIELNRVSADVPSYRLLRAFALVRAGDCKRGMAGIEDLARVLAKGKATAGADLYNIACLFALASKAARGDSSLAQRERDQLANAYASSALEWLRRCAATGFLRDAANRANAVKDPDLDTIRNAPEFASILGPK